MHDRTARRNSRHRNGGPGPVSVRGHDVGRHGRIDACFAPVLDMGEAPQRFSRNGPELGIAPARPGEHSAAVLADWGWTQAEIAALAGQGAS